MKVDILAIGAHPDDIEFGCGGILVKAAESRYRILMVDLTLGEKGSQGTPEIRQKEGKQAAELIKAKRICLNFQDCEVQDSYENRLKLVRIYREYQPRLILAPLWKGEQNHPDHLACGLLARYAYRYSRFSNLLPELPAHTPEGILHYLPHDSHPPHFIIDISKHVETWKKMMLAHVSQMKTFPYEEWMLRKAAFLGDSIGKEYAQGLFMGNPIEVDDIVELGRATREV